MRLPASLPGASAFLLAGCSSGAPSAPRGGAAATTAPPASSATGGAGSATRSGVTTWAGSPVSPAAIPLGDGKVTTTSPRVGYVYSCASRFRGGGARHSGSWINTAAGTWNAKAKLHVAGANSQPDASHSFTVPGANRILKTNDLPAGATTGNFPISPSDPAYRYDTNPQPRRCPDLRLEGVATARLVHPGRLRPGRLWDLPRAGRPRKPSRRRQPGRLSRPDQRHHMGWQARGHVPLRRHAGGPVHRGLLPRDPGQRAPGTRAAKCWGNDRRDACVQIPCGRAAGVGLGSCPCVVHDKVPAGSRTGGPRIAAVRAAERLAQACPSPGTHRPGAATFRACRFASRRVSAAGSTWWCVTTRRVVLHPWRKAVSRDRVKLTAFTTLEASEVLPTGRLEGW